MLVWGGAAGLRSAALFREQFKSSKMPDMAISPPRIPNPTLHALVWAERPVAGSMRSG